MFPLEGVAEECSGALDRRTLETGKGVPLRVRGELGFAEKCGGTLCLAAMFGKEIDGGSRERSRRPGSSRASHA